MHWCCSTPPAGPERRRFRSMAYSSSEDCGRPWIRRSPTSYGRPRSEQFGTEGTAVCPLLARPPVAVDQDYDVEDKGNINRFRHRLPSDVVEYILTHETIRFAGESRARCPSPWPGGRFKTCSGSGVPVQRTPVESMNQRGIPRCRTLPCCASRGFCPS